MAETALIELPLGLPGFPEAHQFVLLDHRPDSVFRWLQCVTMPELAFVVIEPQMFDPSYPLEAVRKHVQFLRLEPDEEIGVLALCTVPPAPAPPTANFLAPIGIGMHSRRGAQILLHDSGYSSRDSFTERSAA